MAIVNREVRAELTRAVVERYQESSKDEKTRILDEFVRLTGFHRKHAVRVLRDRTAEPQRIAASRSRVYDEAARQALIVLWEASDRICGKHLRPLLPLLIESLERHGHLRLDDAIRTKLLRVSGSTIDRLLAPARAADPRRRRRTPPAVRSRIPVRTFADWHDPLPGFMEIDLVAHCGGPPSACLKANATCSSENFERFIVLPPPGSQRRSEPTLVLTCWRFWGERHPALVPGRQPRTINACLDE